MTREEIEKYLAEAKKHRDHYQNYPETPVKRAFLDYWNPAVERWEQTLIEHDAQITEQNLPGFE